MRGTCFVERRLEVVAVAGLVKNTGCGLGAAAFRVFSRHLVFFRKHTACGKYEAALPNLPFYSYHILIYSTRQ